MRSNTDMPMRTLFLAWQDPEKRQWHPVGRLDQSNGTYVFHYTEGAREAQRHGFTPIVSFPDLEATYESDQIFPLFANQVLPPSRPEYDDFIEWLSIPKGEADPVAILARSGERMTDTLEIFPQPDKTSDTTYTAHFFVRGLRHQSPCAIKRSTTLSSGEPLLLMQDLQNPADPHSCVLRTAEREEQDMHMIGYLPRYLAGELAALPDDDLRAARIEVVRVNPSPAPIHFRILCRLTVNWTKDTEPFSDEVYQPLGSAS